MSCTATDALGAARALVGPSAALDAFDGDVPGGPTFTPYPVPAGYPRGYWTVSADARDAAVLGPSRVVVIEKATCRVVFDGPGGDEG